MANNSIIITSEYFVGALDYTHLCAILFGKLERFGQDWDREAVTEIIRQNPRQVVIHFRENFNSRPLRNHFVNGKSKFVLSPSIE